MCSEVKTKIPCIGTPIAKTLRSLLIKHRSDTFMSDRHLINVDPKVFAIWLAARLVIGFYEEATDVSWVAYRTYTDTAEGFQTTCVV